MKNILIGAAVCGAVAGVVYWWYRSKQQAETDVWAEESLQLMDEPVRQIDQHMNKLQELA